MTTPRLTESTVDDAAITWFRAPDHDYAHRIGAARPSARKLEASL